MPEVEEPITNFSDVSETPTSATEKKSPNQEILEAPDAKAALETYLKLKKDYEGEFLAKLQDSMAEKLLQLGESDKAFNFTSMAERTRITERSLVAAENNRVAAEIMTRTMNQMEEAMISFKSSVNGLGESAQQIGLAGQKIEQSANELEHTGRRFLTAAEGITQAATKNERSAETTDEASRRMSTASANMQEAAAVINRASHR